MRVRCCVYYDSYFVQYFLMQLTGGHKNVFYVESYEYIELYDGNEVGFCVGV